MLSTEHLTGLSHQSQNKTAGFFTQLYQGHATRTHAPLATLYDDIRAVLHSSSDRNLHNIVIENNPPKDMVAGARKFFRDIFPLAYHNLMKLEAKQFTPEYEACLKDAYDAVQPFGDVPQRVSTEISLCSCNFHFYTDLKTYSFFLVLQHILNSLRVM